MPIVIATAAEPPLTPVRVCEVFQDLQAYSGKTVLVLGRFSYRGEGRFLSEKTCETKMATTVAVSTTAPPPALRIVIDTKSGPTPPDKLAVDSSLLDRKLAVVKKSTALASFRFGSTDYDRWAVVYGRVEVEPEQPESAPPKTRGKSEFEAPTRLVCRGEALVIFIADRGD
jgi:hypothetical protein